MCKYLVLLTCLFLLTYSISVPAVFAQERAEVKEKAEKELQKMTSEQVDAKIKEAGMTRAEAEAKAKEYGINLEQYLSSKGPTQVQTQLQYQPNPTDTLRTAGQSISIPPASSKIQIPFDSTLTSQSTIFGTSVPGFEGRKNAESLGLFGYNIFNFPASTFEPVLNVPTPQNYILGPGDEVLLTMWGETQLFLQLVINREGEITIPNVGPVVAQGLTIAQLKARLLSRMTSFYSGLRGGANGANTWLDLSIGKLRSMQVFVLGEVKKPGGYAISSMSTALLGLYVAGGPTINGSLREIQILRENKAISIIDFYNFALRGDKSKDMRLQDGDVIFVKPAGKRVALTGRIVRPAIYELRSGETLSDLLTLAGGLQFTSYTDRVHVERIIPFAERKKFKKNILDIDVKLASVEELQNSKFVLEDGDIVSILKINELYQNRVTISGNVKKPGTFELSPEMRIRDLVKMADGYLSDTFEERGNILRVLPNQRIEIVPFNLAKAMEGDSLDNVQLESEDEVTIYNKKYFFPEHPVTIGGAVRRPGTMVRAEHLMVSDLLVLAGGLAENALGQEVIVTRMDTTSEVVYSKSYTVEIPLDFWQTDRRADFELKDYDYVFVPTNPNFHTTKLVTVNGEVKYPGTYAILFEGERMASVIKRAGGLKQNAYIDGARLLRSYGGAGLVPVNFRSALEDERDKANIELVEGDQIIIDKNPRVVYVRGEVGVPSAVVYEEGAGLNYYLSQAGDIKETGDKDKVVVMQPNGRKWTPSWFFFADGEILAGATITVPVKVERDDKTLPILRDWATIFASLATMMVVIVQITK
ncbi:MAG TPA: SLBB domain-containing protein [Bacteroidota bacterium]|nr:SLBB domain-containing protein [Bacteroidota bacterium]